MNDLALIPSKDEFAVIREYVKVAKETGHYKHLMKDGDDGQVLLILLTAREFGIPLMAALNGGINIVKGKVELSVHMKTFKILQGGNSLKSWFSEDNKTCHVKGTRRDTGLSATETFSFDDAKRAGLLGRENWSKYPKEMLYARAMSRIANKLFPDVVGGVTYARGEIDPIAMDEDGVEPIDTDLCIVREEPKKETPPDAPETCEDTLDMVTYELYKLFPGEDALFYEFAYEKALRAGVDVPQMYVAMYNKKESVIKRFTEWKEIREKTAPPEEKLEEGAE